MKFHRYQYKPAIGNSQGDINTASHPEKVTRNEPRTLSPLIQNSTANKYLNNQLLYNLI